MSCLPKFDTEMENNLQREKAFRNKFAHQHHLKFHKHQQTSIAALIAEVMEAGLGDKLCDTNHNCRNYIPC